MSSTLALHNPRIPHPLRASVSPFPVSLTYQSKVLSLRARIKSRLKALKYHYDRINLADDRLYHSHSKILSRAVFLLDTTNFICNDAYKRAYWLFTFFPMSNDEHVIKLFGRTIPRKSRIDYQYEDAERLLKYAKKISKNVAEAQNTYDFAQGRLKIYKVLKDKLRLECLAQRRSVLKKRVRYAITQSAHEGWFMVFATLTVDDSHLDIVFSQNSSSWTDYIRSIDRAVGIRCHGSWSNALKARLNGDDFHRYFAVVEYGGQTGRPHIHVIHMMKQLPHGCSDPNLGMLTPYNLNIDGMRHFWSFGKCSTWIPMRYSNSDAFSKINWRWPSPKNKKTGKYVPVPLGTALRVANYVCKYINKSYAEDRRKGEIKWRTKMSRKLGLKPMELLINQMSHQQISRSIINPPTLILLNQRLPKTMFRRLLFRRWLNRKSSTRSFIRKLWVLSRLEPKENILKRFANSEETTLEFNPEKCGDIRIKILPNMDTFDLQTKLNNISLELFGLNPLDCPSAGSGGYTGERFYG